MNRIFAALALSSAAVVSAPALADPLPNGANGVTFTTFNPATRGTLLSSLNYTNQRATPASAATYTANLRTAVYRNTSGTLDFWYQVAVTAIDPGDMVTGLTASSFLGYNVSAFFSGGGLGDPDGAGIFTAPFNPGTFTSTASRNASGFTIRSDFGANGLVAGETSATYIFRTNATRFDTLGSFAVHDGSTVTVAGFRPILPPVPEPATWALMILGFGFVGYGMRRQLRRSDAKFDLRIRQIAAGEIA